MRSLPRTSQNPRPCVVVISRFQNIYREDRTGLVTGGGSSVEEPVRFHGQTDKPLPLANVFSLLTVDCSVSMSSCCSYSVSDQRNAEESL